MSEQEHQYQGRQSALQVFNEFAGGVGGVEQQQLEDDEDEVEQERGEDEKKLQNEKVKASWNCNVLICSRSYKLSSILNSLALALALANNFSVLLLSYVTNTQFKPNS